MKKIMRLLPLAMVGCLTACGFKACSWNDFRDAAYKVDIAKTYSKVTIKSTVKQTDKSTAKYSATFIRNGETGVWEAKVDNDDAKVLAIRTVYDFTAVIATLAASETIAVVSGKSQYTYYTGSGFKYETKDSVGFTASYTFNKYGYRTHLSEETVTSKSTTKTTVDWTWSN